MKIKDGTLAKLADAIAKYDTEENRERYRARQFPRAEAVRDLDKRYRWDLYYAAWGHTVVPDNVNDAHVDTALRRIVKPLEG